MEISAKEVKKLRDSTGAGMMDAKEALKESDGNVDEAIRILDALQFHEKNGEVCPANWVEGKEAMTANTQGLETYFQKA